MSVSFLTRGLPNMSFVMCKQELSYFCRPQGAVDAYMEVPAGDTELQCLCFDGSYTNT